MNVCRVFLQDLVQVNCQMGAVGQLPCFARHATCPTNCNIPVAAFVCCSRVFD